MLTVAKVTGTLAAGYADYLQGKVESELGDYYLKDGERVEAAGRWIAGANTVGADREAQVEGGVLKELMAVRNPQTGEALRRVGATGEAVAALDATFSAPKSVSAVWALADSQLRALIETAHEHAINQAIHYSLTQVPMIRERLNQSTVINARVSDLVATGWRHTTARSVDGRPPDPQLHTHVLLHAAVRRDGRLVAIDSRSWLTHRREVGAAYRTELAHQLAQLGFQIQRGTGRGGRYFEIAGVPQGLLDRWSSRHLQIREAIAQRLAQTGRGALSPAEERLAAVTTRSGKQPATVADLDREWQQTASEAGFGRGSADRLRGNGPAPVPPAEPRVLLEGLTEFDATFTDREARAVALEQSAGVPIDDALAGLRAARTEGVLLELADGSRTTSWHRATEHTTVSTFRTLAENTVQPIPEELVDQAAAQVDRQLAAHGGRLSGEQLEALRLACGDGQVVMVEGQAGTGKSTLLQAVALAHHADQRELIVTSTAGLAAQRLAADITDVGMPATPYSTVALQHAIQTGQLELGPETAVIHDEAALASTREQHQLFRQVEETGARLIIVGDPAQSQPVGAGGLWPRLQQIAEQQELRVELTQNLRALDPADRRDQQLFRKGQFEQALAGYTSRGRVHSGPDQREVEHEALLAAQHDRRSGLRTVVIAQTSNEHLDELNAHAQALRHRDGELGQESVPVPGRPYHLHAGDHIQIRRGIAHPGGRLRNGTTATVSRIGADQRMTVRLADDTERTLDQAHVAEADMRLAYVQHPFPAQGITTDTAHLIVAGNATRNGTYVAITRARQETHIHTTLEPDRHETNLTEELAEHLGRDEPDLPSIETPLAHKQPERVWVTSDRPAVEHNLGWEL